MRWEDNIREWTGLEVGMSQRAVENREEWRKWLQSHLWCPSDPHGQGIDDDVFLLALIFSEKMDDPNKVTKG